MEGCRGKSSSRKNLWVHFDHQHPRDSIVILEEGNQPHSWLPRCVMFVSQEALNQVQPTSAMWRCGAEKKLRRLVVVETEERMGRVFLEYGTLLMVVSSLRYLVRMLLSSIYDWPAVEWNLRRAQRKWGRLAKILGREGEDRRTAGRFYVVVVQAVLLFESKTWVLTTRSEISLGRFQHRLARQMSDMVPKNQRGGAWVYPRIG